MTSIYEVLADVEGGPFHVGTFFDFPAARAFCDAENDELQVELLEIHERPLVDKYGFPCSSNDL